MNDGVKALGSNVDRGPRFLKLSKKVVYPLEQIKTFESKALYASTSERAS